MIYNRTACRSIIIVLVISIAAGWMSMSTIAQGQANASAVEGFVQRLYTIALERDAEPGGLRFWTQQLDTRRHTAAQVVFFMLLEAPEFLNKGHSDAQFVEICYRTFFNRPADPDGKAFWLRELRTGHTRRGVIARMLDAPTAEFHRLCQAAGIETGRIGTSAADRPNTVGNTTGNLNSLGFTAVQGDWIYYAYYALDTKHKGANYGHLYRVRINGRDTARLTDSPVAFINVIREWIYYIDVGDNGGWIYRMMTDGSGKSVVARETATRLTVTQQHLYFIDYTDRNLYRMNLDGTGKTRILDHPVGHYHVSGTTIFYTNMRDSGRLYRHSQGQSVKIGNDPAGSLQGAGQWLYYTNGADGDSIYRIRTDGSQRTKLSQGSAAVLNLSGERLFFSSGNTLFRMGLNGSGLRRVMPSGQELSAMWLNVHHGWIYAVNDKDELIRVRVNGTEASKIQP
jgi:hypothetical protein